MSHILTYTCMCKLTLASAVSFALFISMLLMAWITDAVLPLNRAAPTGDGDTDASEVVPEWKLFHQTAYAGVICGPLSYVFHSIGEHHLLTGYYALQAVLGPLIGSAMFGAIGLLIHNRLLGYKGLGVFLLYLSSTLAVGPMYVSLIMLALDLPRMTQ